MSRTHARVRYHDLIRAWKDANLPGASNDEATKELIRRAERPHIAEADLRAARNATTRAQDTIDGAARVLDRLDVAPGLLSDRILALAVERETAREDRNRYILARDRALAQAEHRSFLALVLGVALAAAVVAGLLAALGFIPTLSVA